MFSKAVRTYFWSQAFGSQRIYLFTSITVVILNCTCFCNAIKPQSLLIVELITGNYEKRQLIFSGYILFDPFPLT